MLPMNTEHRVEGKIIGVNEINLSVITIWLKRTIDDKFQLITLKKKEKCLNYKRVSLNRELPEYQLKKGEVDTLIDTVTHPNGGELGYVL